MAREKRKFSSLCVPKMHTFRAETQPPDLIAARSGNKLISHKTERLQDPILQIIQIPMVVLRGDTKVRLMRISRIHRDRLLFR